MSHPLFSIGFIQILIILVNMGRAKVLAMLLGPAGFGIVATIDQIVLSVVQIAGFAVPFIALKLLSFTHSENHERFQIAYSSFLSGILGLSISSTLILLGILQFKPDLFGDDIAPYLNYLQLALFGVPTLMLSFFFVNTLAAGQKAASSAYLNFIVTLCLSIAACLGVFFGDILGLYFATIATGIVTSVATVIYVNRYLGVKIRHKDAGFIKYIRQKPQIVSMALVLHVALSAYSVAMLVIRYFVF